MELSKALVFHANSNEVPEIKEALHNLFGEELVIQTSDIGYVRDYMSTQAQLIIFAPSVHPIKVRAIGRKWPYEVYKLRIAPKNQKFVRKSKKRYIDYQTDNLKGWDPAEFLGFLKSLN
jgi:hypothetical protein